jgi:nucleoside-diphosphate-sugar epimerase
MLIHAPCAIGEHIDETSPIAPTWPYPESKVGAEEAIRTGRGRMPAMVLRIAGVYTDYCDSIPLAHQIQRIYERRLTATVFPGDTAAGQSMVHLDDAVGACVRPWRAADRSIRKSCCSSANTTRSPTTSCSGHSRD